MAQPAVRRQAWADLVNSDSDDDTVFQEAHREVSMSGEGAAFQMPDSQPRRHLDFYDMFSGSGESDPGRHREGSKRFFEGSAFQQPCTTEAIQQPQQLPQLLPAQPVSMQLEWQLPRQEHEQNQQQLQQGWQQWQQKQKQKKNHQQQRQHQQRQPTSPTSPVEDGPPNSDQAEWEKRQQRREEAVRKTKALPLYLATLKVCHIEGDEGKPQTPRPSDRSLRKRVWEAKVAQWKDEMRFHCERHKRHLTKEEMNAIQKKSDQ